MNGRKSSGGESVALDLPFSGAWKSFIAPADAEGAAGAFGRLLARATGHRHAFDFVGLDENLGHRRPGSLWRRFAGEAGDHHAFSRTILVPFDGEVIVARDGWPDRNRTDLISVAGMLLSRPKISEEDLRAAAGNHVLIRSGTVVAFLAHLRCGSLKVREGQRVGSGQPVGEVAARVHRTRRTCTCSCWMAQTPSRRRAPHTPPALRVVERRLLGAGKRRCSSKTGTCQAASGTVA